MREDNKNNKLEGHGDGKSYDWLLKCLLLSN